jgi:hypothetical protein
LGGFVPVTVTKEFLEAWKTERGGYTKRQVQALGFKTWTSGWKRGMIGKVISDEQADAFKAASNRHRPPKIFLTPINLPEQEISRAEQYNHPLWQKKRLEVMQRDHFHCMFCGSREKQLHVHHNTYDGAYLWTCSLASMITVCGECHEKMHGRKFT